MLLYLCESSPLFSFKVRHNKNVPNLLITTIKREDADQNNFYGKKITNNQIEATDYTVITKQMIKQIYCLIFLLEMNRYIIDNKISI